MFRAAKTGAEAGMSNDDPGYASGEYRDASNLGAWVTLHDPDDDCYQAGPGLSLENGEEQLSRWFGDVRLLRREDSRFVTEYLFSGTIASAALDQVLGLELTSRPGIRVTKDTGVFVARD